jgi:hypothetical protein
MGHTIEESCENHPFYMEFSGKVVLNGALVRKVVQTH